MHGIGVVCGVGSTTESPPPCPLSSEHTVLALPTALDTLEASKLLKYMCQLAPAQLSSHRPNLAVVFSNTQY